MDDEGPNEAALEDNLNLMPTNGLVDAKYVGASAVRHSVMKSR